MPVTDIATRTIRTSRIEQGLAPAVLAGRPAPVRTIADEINRLHVPATRDRLIGTYAIPGVGSFAITGEGGDPSVVEGGASEPFYASAPDT